MRPSARVCAAFSFVLAIVGGCARDASPSRTTTASDSSSSTGVSIDANSVVTVPQPVALVERSSRDKFAFLVSQSGVIYRWSYEGLPSPVLDITALTKAGGERGLLGLAFRDTYAYVDYTDIAGNTVIAEYVVSADGTFVASSRRDVLTIDQPYPNHNGGQVVVGPDNMLYIGMGDGGSAKDPDRVAQSTRSLLGKILRIDPTPSGNAAYTIPPDNPFVGVDGARPEIWAVGLRNPWRFTFDDDGNIWVADVGQNQWEEIDFVAASTTGTARQANFGWSAYEGTHRFNTDQHADDSVLPIFEYPHGPDGCSVSGGARVSRTSPLTSLRGTYLFSDYCAGRIVALDIDNGSLTGHRALTDKIGSIVAVQQTSRGVFALSITGEVYALSLR